MNNGAGALTRFASDFQIARQLERSVLPQRGYRSKLYAIYYMLLIGLVLGVPIWIALRDAATAGSPLIRALLSVDLPIIVLAAAVPLSVFLFGIGAVLSPISGPGFLLYLVSAGPQNRIIPYGLRVARTGTVLAVGFAALVTLLWSLNPASLTDLLLGIVASVSAAAVILAIWLLGSIVTPTKSRIGTTAAVCIIASLVAATLLLEPIRNVVLSTALQSSLVPLNTITYLGICGLSLAICSFAIVQLSKRVNANRLLAQASRWQSIATYAGVGDLNTARAQFEIPSAIGRNWEPPNRANFWQLSAWASLVSLARAPWRVLWILLLQIMAVLVLLSLPFVTLSLSAPYLGVGLSAVLQFFALLLFSGRINFAISQTVPPQLFGGTDFRLIFAQVTIPIAVFTLTVAIGFIVAYLVLGNFSPLAVIWNLVMLPFQLAILVYSTLTREPPSWLLLQVGSPMGESALLMALWQTDLIWLPAAFGIVAYLLIVNPNVLTIGLILAAAFWLVVAIRRRHLRLR